MTPAERLEKNRLALQQALEKTLRQQSVRGYYGKCLVDCSFKDGSILKPIKVTQLTPREDGAGFILTEDLYRD